MDIDQYLPPHWSCHYDGEHRTYYYYNAESGVTQWENPSLPATPYPYSPPKNRVTSAQPYLSDASVYPKEWGADPAPENTKRGKQRSKKIKSQMPQHMLLETSSVVETSAPPLDRYDSYSDMDEMDGDRNDFDFTVPIFDIPEDRRQFLHRRESVSPIVGGSNQDYLGMARLYKVQRPYSDTEYSKACVICRKKKSTHVFFPCEHHCVCEGCIKSEEICADSKMSTKNHGCCNCPLCAAVIKKILPFDHGNEVELYWSWVYEIPPPLPTDFLKNFKHSAGVIEAVHMNRDDDNNSDHSTASGTSCVLS